MDPFLESSSLNRQIYFPISNRLNFYPHTMHQTFLVIYKFFPLQIDRLLLAISSTSPFPRPVINHPFDFIDSPRITDRERERKKESMTKVECKTAINDHGLAVWKSAWKPDTLKWWNSGWRGDFGGWKGARMAKSVKQARNFGSCDKVSWHGQLQNLFTASTEN